MGQLSPALRTELHKAKPAAYLVLDVGGGTLKISKEGVNSASLGVFKARVSSWGTFQRALSDQRGGLQNYTANVVIRDEDLEITRIAGDLFGQEAIVYLVSPNIDWADITEVFVGVVGGITPGPASWTLLLRQDNKWLEGPFGHLITEARWPNAPAASREIYEPKVYGYHNSTDPTLDSKGMVPCPACHFATNVLWSLVSVGVCQDVDRVYRNDTLATVVTHYNVEVINQRGTTYTVIKWVSGVAAADDKITCDVHGLTDVADGSGTLLENPAQILKHALVNFAHGDWSHGDWLDDSTAPVKTAYFTIAAAFFDALTYKASRLLGGKNDAMTGQDLITGWCHDLEMMAFWTMDGKLAVFQWDHRLQNDGVYPLVGDSNAPALNLNVHAIGQPTLLPFNDEAYVPRVTVKFCHSGVDDKFLGSTVVEDMRSLAASNEELESRWIPSNDPQTWIGLAWDIASRRINRWRRNVVAGVQVTLPAWFLDAELTQDIPVAWDRGFNPVGAPGWGLANYQRRLLRTTSLSLDGDRMEVTAILENCFDSQCSFVATSRTRLGSLSDDGFMFLSVGFAGFEFSRASPKIVEDPVDGRLVLVAGGVMDEDDQVAYDRRGLYLEGGRTNLAASSSDGPPSNWTDFGHSVDDPTLTGEHGSRITSGNSGPPSIPTAFDLLWDPTWVPSNGTYMLAGTPHTESHGRAQANILIPGNAVFTFSIDYKNVVGGGPLIVDIQRADGKFWNQDDREWQSGSSSYLDVPPVGSPKNELGVSEEWRREQWKAIPLEEVSDTNIGIVVWQPAGGTAGRVDRFVHVQVEVGTWASSRIITTSAPEDREPDVMSWPNDGASSKHFIPQKRGTLYVEAITDWNAADVPDGEKKWIWHVHYDANNEMGAYWEKDSEDIVFYALAAGIPYTRSMSCVPVANTAIRLAFRWGSDGDLGVSDKSMQLFVNDVKSAEADPVAALPTPAAGKQIYHGVKADGTGHWDGVLRYWRVSPFCQPDEQVVSGITD